MNKYLIVTLYVFCSTKTIAQTNSDKLKIPANVYLSYNGGIISSGIKGGLKYPILVIDKIKFKKNSRINKIKYDHYITSNFGWLYHEGFNNNLQITLGYDLWRTNSKGFYTFLSPEIGFCRTFLDGTVYQVSNDQQVSIHRHAGYNYALATIGGGIGYNFSITKSKPFSIYTKLNILGISPYNSTLFLTPNIEAGVVFTPSGFLLINTKHLSK